MAHLDKLGLFHMDLGLERVETALQRLKLTSPDFGVIHVVGTNGKGSTSRTLAELATAHGLRAGLFSSPHFITPRERIHIDGRMLSPDSWTKLGNRVMEISEDTGLTYFEFITVLAILAFAEAGVDVAIMEAGLGGTYDAACAMRTDLTVFTNIGMDHEAILGDTLAAIATDKAGALRKDVPAISTPQEDDAAHVLTTRAKAVGAPFAFAPDVMTYVPDLGTAYPTNGDTPMLTGIFPAMSGPHQERNANLALSAWYRYSQQRGMDINSKACSRALRKAVVPGRFQHIDGQPEFYLDGAHNPQALTALCDTVKAEGIAPSAIIFACLADKDLDTIAPLVASLGDCPIIVPELHGNSRARDAAETARAIGENAHPAQDINAALAEVENLDGPILLCGSLYLLAAFFTLHPEHLNENQTDYTL